MSEEEESENILNQAKRTAIDINKLFTVLLYRWYVVFASVLICLIVVYVQLRYTTPLYRAEITLKLDDEKPSQMSDLFKYGRTTGKFDNFLNTESEIIKSKHFAEKALEDLGLDYIYIVEGKILTTEIYPNPYFNIKTIQTDSLNPEISFNVEYVSPTTYRLTDVRKNNKSAPHRIFDSVSYEGHVFCIVPPPDHSASLKRFKTVTCNKIDYKKLASSFAGGIGVEIIKGTSIIKLDFIHEVPEFASDYLNVFAKIYINQTISDKSQAAQQTIDFIDRQLLDLAAKVQKNEFELSDIKSQSKGAEIGDVADNEVQKLATLESDKNILLINHEFVLKLQRSLTESKDNPVNFVVFDKEDAANIPDLLKEFNETLLERISLLQKNTPLSPIAIENETKLKELRSILLKTIKNVDEKIKVKIEFLNKQIAEVNEVLGSIPMKQRMLINIQRDFKVNEKVYSYLFEKKLETSISKSSITPNATIIQASEIPSSPISPNRSRYYSFALLLGLVIGLGIIAASRLLYQKIPDKETIENISNVKVLGVLKKITNVVNEYEIHAFKNPKSVFSESMRSIRTGINFISKGQEKKIICLTSTVSGEGKTFCTINLAASLTLLNKRVIIIGCDLRRPKVHLSFNNINNTHGLTTYLIGKSSLEQIIQHTKYELLDVITAGPSPPNPSELLHMQEMKDLLEILKKTYDYILIDSAPVGLVSDSMIIMQLADINLYVLRAQYSSRDFASIPDKLKMDNNIKNIYTILNAYDRSSIYYSSIYKNDYGGYYSGGGYYYGGYYGKGGYGYYGKKHKGNYYTGYVNEDDSEEEQGFFSIPFLRKLFKKKID